MTLTLHRYVSGKSFWACEVFETLVIRYLSCSIIGD